MWILGIQLRFSGLATGTFSCWACAFFFNQLALDFFSLCNWESSCVHSTISYTVFFFFYCLGIFLMEVWFVSSSFLKIWVRWCDFYHFLQSADVMYAKLALPTQNKIQLVFMYNLFLYLVDLYLLFFGFRVWSWRGWILLRISVCILRGSGL